MLTVFHNFIYLNVYLFMGERESARTHERVRGSKHAHVRTHVGTGTEGAYLQADSLLRVEPLAGLDHTTLEITT